MKSERGTPYMIYPHTSGSECWPHARARNGSWRPFVEPRSEPAFLPVQLPTSAWRNAFLLPAKVDISNPGLSLLSQSHVSLTLVTCCALTELLSLKTRISFLMDRNLECRFNQAQTFQTLRMNSPEEFPLLGPKSSIEPFAGLQIDVDFPGVLENLNLNKQK